MSLPHSGQLALGGVNRFWYTGALFPILFLFFFSYPRQNVKYLYMSPLSFPCVVFPEWLVDFSYKLEDEEFRDPVLFFCETTASYGFPASSDMDNAYVHSDSELLRVHLNPY